jgi:alpha-galactosidase
MFFMLLFVDAYCIGTEANMDDTDILQVRFHFNGEFISSRNNHLFYCGGKQEISYIHRDKVSLPKIWGHLKDHCCNVEDGALLHWLYPGKDLINGLRVLVDDTSCIQMADTIMKGEVAEIYVEAPQHEAGDDLGHESASKVTALTEMNEDRERDNQFVRAWHSPSKVVKQTAVLEASSQPSVDKL